MADQIDSAHVVSVSKDGTHRFSKIVCDQIRLIPGEGIEGDAHRGVTVKHRSRVKIDPTQPNLRQVHLISIETISELREQGFDVHPATMGENITTGGIDLLELPKNTRLLIGDATIEVKGLRNPCKQLEAYQKGLTAAVLDKGQNGELIRKAGIMGIVLNGGVIQSGSKIHIEMPSKPHKKLERV